MKSGIKAQQDKIEYISTSKDEIVKSKQDSIDFISEIVKSKLDMIDLLNKRAVEKELEFYRSRGLMNLRGVFELLLTICVSENPPSRYLRTVTQRIDYITSLRDSKIEGKHTRELLKITKDLGCNLHSFYHVLNDEIHGMPWDKHSIRIFTRGLRSEDRVLAERLVRIFDVEVELYLSPPEISEEMTGPNLVKQ
jgi:hypothetical protein